MEGREECREEGSVFVQLEPFLALTFFFPGIPREEEQEREVVSRPQHTE